MKLSVFPHEAHSSLSRDLKSHFEAFHYAVIPSFFSHEFIQELQKKAPLQEYTYIDRQIVDGDESSRARLFSTGQD